MKFVSRTWMMCWCSAAVLNNTSKTQGYSSDKSSVAGKLFQKKQINAAAGRIKLPN